MNSFRRGLPYDYKAINYGEHGKPSGLHFLAMRVAHSSCQGRDSRLSWRLYHAACSHAFGLHTYALALARWPRAPASAQPRPHYQMMSPKWSRLPSIKIPQPWHWKSAPTETSRQGACLRPKTVDSAALRPACNLQHEPAGTSKFQSRTVSRSEISLALSLVARRAGAARAAAAARRARSRQLAGARRCREPSHPKQIPRGHPGRTYR